MFGGSLHSLHKYYHVPSQFYERERGKVLPPTSLRGEDVSQIISDEIKAKFKIILMSAIPLLINLIVTNIQYNSSVYEVKLNQTFH